jgi:DNA ligase D-like protein (predicted polymerase)/DNA ligase D-like protein (predicted 3'-phosphoesterase)
MGLSAYQRKRNFDHTPEPRGRIEITHTYRFVVHEHHASHLHYDFRLEMSGVLKSWAVPKGPSLNPRQKRLAVMVEDHPVEYLTFSGRIEEGNYGAGDVAIWDTGRYELPDTDDPVRQLEAGKLSIVLYGKKLRGEFHLVRLKGRTRQWLLIKGNDEFAEATGKATGESSNERDTTERSHPVVSLPHALRARNLHGDLTLKVEGHTVALTHLERVYWPAEGYRKGDLLRYYFTVAPTLLPYLQGRPLILKRHPNGITGQSFYQHDVDAVPDFVNTFSTRAESGKVVDYAVCNNLATLLYLVNLGTLEQNPWHSRVQSIDCPDWIVFDLDPHEVEFAAVQELALGLKDLLDRLGLASYPKTSGASGMHVYVPIASLYSYEQVAQFAEVVARRVAEKYPQLGTLERSLKKRKSGRIYLDHLQNARGKSVVAPYSVRAQAEATVSTPLTWAEVEHPLSPTEFTLATLPRRLTQHGDLFAPVLAHKQDLRAAIEKLEDLFRRSHSTTASKEQSHRPQTPKKKRLAGPVVEKVTQSTTRSTRVKAARGRSRARH